MTQFTTVNAGQSRPDLTRDETPTTHPPPRTLFHRCKAGLIGWALPVACRKPAAFDRLPRYGRCNNLRLSEVARRVVDRELDPDMLTSDTARLTRRPS
jgi:hypothetical protein